MKVLGIETSCDETSVAVVEGREILSNVIASQAVHHAPFGGVVPEIASRHHVENLPFVLEEALKKADLSLQTIDAVAGTHTPGLLGALLVGLQYAKALSFALQKPFIGVNHLEAHLNSVFLEDPTIDYPFLGLIVSGGHTHLYHAHQFGKYILLGKTRDDACGEAYDKVAKLLKLEYPGGPLLDKMAQEGNPKAFRLKIPKLEEGSLDFSFSGVKTACLLEVQKQKGKLSENFVRDLAASFQEMATDFLILRLTQAAGQTGLKKIALTGGVAANQTLRKKLKQLAEQNHFQYSVPPMPLCTDNAAMIAYVGGCRLNLGESSPWSLNAEASSELPK